jgi:hypothetical protein
VHFQLQPPASGGFSSASHQPWFQLSLQEPGGGLLGRMGGGPFFLGGGGLPASGGLHTFWQSVMRMQVIRQRPEPHCELRSHGSHSFGGALQAGGGWGSVRMLVAACASIWVALPDAGLDADA